MNSLKHCTPPATPPAAPPNTPGLGQADCSCKFGLIDPPEVANKLRLVEERTEQYAAGLLRFWVPRLMRTERAIYSGKFKLVASTRGTRSLFDLEDDPKEQNNLSTALPDVMNDLGYQLELWTAQIQAGGKNLELDPETLERLRSLGYVN